MMPSLQDVIVITRADLAVSPASCLTCGQTIVAAGMPMFPTGHSCGQTSGAYGEAVRCRASSDGAVPYYLINQMTAAQWQRIRVMGPTAARRIIAEMERDAATARLSGDIDMTIAELTREGR